MILSVCSHELKTPVTSIKGHVQYLMRILDKEPASESSTRLKLSLFRMDKLIIRLTKLIADILDMKRVAAGRLDLQRENFYIDVMVAQVVEDFKLSHQQHNFKLRLTGGTQINADRDKISQVIINLLANAIKYAPNSHSIDVTLTSSAKDVQLKIKDYGIGIEEKDQKKIFERFYRVEGQNEAHFGGFGIGLYLVNSIVENHEGTVSLESSKGEGATFIVQLPLAKLGMLK